jgi:hypothetical protein
MFIQMVLLINHSGVQNTGTLWFTMNRFIVLYIPGMMKLR